MVGEDSCVKAKRICAVTVTLSGTVNHMDFQNICILAMARFLNVFFFLNTDTYIYKSVLSSNW